MKMRSLGWELVCFLVVLAAALLGLAAGWSSLVGLSMRAAAVVAPVIVMSFLVRLVVGIVDENRRVRALRVVSRR